MTPGRSESYVAKAIRRARLLALESIDPDPLDDLGEIDVDVVMPVGPADVELVGTCLEGIERNVSNRVRRVVLVVPAALVARVRRVGFSCDIVADEDVLPEELRLAVVRKLGDRSGWFVQQLVKLSLPDLTDAKSVLVVDADTVVLRPRLFRSGSTTLMLASREYHVPYYEALARLWREPVDLPRFSCVAHHMCFLTDELRAVQEMIEEVNGIDWRRAVLNSVSPSTGAGFSEYELYGQWRLRYRRVECAVRGLHNVPLSRSSLEPVPALERRLPGSVHSVSFHHYLGGAT